MTNLEDLTVFVRIAAAGSLSQAARDLGISLPVVSKRLARLEETLAVRLVNRSTRHVSLTDDGHDLLPRARDILARVEEAEAAVQSRHTEASGILRITATVAFAVGQIAPRLGRFMALNPDLRIHLLSTDKMLDIVEDNVDVAVRQAILPDSNLVSRVIAPDRRVLVASPAYVERHGKPARPEDLARHRCIVLGDPPVTSWRFRRGNRKASVDVGWTMLANDGAAAHAACLGGAGIALKSIWDSREDLDEGRLVELLPGWAAPSMPIRAVFVSRNHLPARIRAFIDFFQDELRQEVARHPAIEAAAD
jgi:DNA-binding transcriptional LysR family regulator